ncbi:Uncharacterised protein [Klebsiella pneumoniae]|nr:Uncharacterised protein [Klebsiella pneumoniae]
MEVTAGDDVIFGGKDQRVIGDRVGFSQQHLSRLADLRQAGAHHLRLAAQGVRVLHLAAVMVRLRDRAIFGQQVAIQRRRINLPALAAHFMDARIKRTT